MAQNGAGDSAPAVNSHEIKEPSKGEKAETFSWPDLIGSPSEALQKNAPQMTPRDVETFGQGDVSNGVMQFSTPRLNLLDKIYTSNGCTYISGEKGSDLADAQDQMAIDDLSKPIGNRLAANGDEQRLADEIAALAPKNTQGATEEAINGNERMREIFSELSSDATRNVIDTANRAMQKDGFRLVQSENGQIRLAETTPTGPDVGIHLKEPDCNQS